MVIPMCGSVGLAGVPYVGVDIGGFGGDCTPELYARWVQMGVFTPLCRTHSAIGTRDQEPWSFGPETESIARKYLSLRYQLMPYTYSLFEEASRTGSPVMRPLAYSYPADEQAYEVSDEILWGDAFLVAPICKEKTTRRAVYLPEGEWHDFWSGERHVGPSWIVARAPLDVLPLYVRSGSIVPSCPVVEYEGQKPIDALCISVYTGKHGAFTLYEDDGETLAYQEGQFATTSMEYVETGDARTLRMGDRTGQFVPAQRTVTVEFLGVFGRPRVSVDGQQADPVYDEGRKSVSVSWPDDGKAHEVVLK